MRVWKATCSITVCIAEEEKPSERACAVAATKEVTDGVGSWAFKFESVNEIERERDIPDEWEDSIPWGEKTDRTVYDLIRNKKG
jgi:hypothetical protein